MKILGTVLILVFIIKAIIRFISAVFGNIEDGCDLFSEMCDTDTGYKSYLLAACCFNIAVVYFIYEMMLLL